MAYCGMALSGPTQTVAAMSMWSGIFPAMILGAVLGIGTILAVILYRKQERKQNKAEKKRFGVRK